MGKQAKPLKSWECLESPTNAHHWVETKVAGEFTCKYCEETRTFVTDFNAAQIKSNKIHWRKTHG